MASILKPYSGLLNPGRLQVPNGPLAIDWTHPLTRSLIACYVPGVMGGVDVTGSGPALNNAVGGLPTNATPAMTPEGAATTNYWKSFEPIPALFTNQVAMTLYWRGMLIVNSGSFEGVLQINYSDPGSSPVSIAQLSSDSTGLQDKTAVFWNNAGSQNTSFGFATPLAINKMASYAATMPVGGTAFVYHNGLVDPNYPTGANFGASPPNSTATSVLYVGSPSTYTNIALIWNRALSADEMFALDLDPYGFLIPAEAEMPIALFQAPPPLIPTSFSILSNIVTQTEVISY